MIRRYTAVLMILCMLVPFAGLSAFADESKYDKTVSEIVQLNNEKNKGMISYKEYLMNYSKYAYSLDDITISAEVYEKDQGANVVKDGTNIIWKSETGTVTWKFTVPSGGLYNLYFNYYALPGKGNDIELGLKIDGHCPYAETQNFKLARMWQNATKVTADERGNQYIPEQKELLGWQKGAVMDSDGFYNDPLLFALSAGDHTISLTAIAEPLKIENIIFTAPEKTLNYEKIKADYITQGYKNYDGDEIVIEGESSDIKSSKSLVPLSDNTDPAVYPNDPFLSKINYIGGSNWKMIGDTLSWTVNVPESRLYKIAFHFRQTYLLEAASYRSLKIDGKVPFSEAESMAFTYGVGWQFQVLNSNGKPLLLYLTEGKHNLSLTVTLGELSNFSQRLKSTVYELGIIYRQIVMITGETPDHNRDYNLFSSIPDLGKRLIEVKNELNKLATESEQLIGKRGGSNASVLRKVTITIKKMLEKKYEAHKKKQMFYDGYASLSSWLYEMQSMALDIDAIVLAAPDKKFERTSSGIFERLGYSLQRLYASFVTDYSTISTVSDSDTGKTITLWVNWGRDQTQVLNSLTTNDFTPKHGIKVIIRITNASLIQAILSGNGPDCSLSVSRTDPVNYAMRGAVYNLSNFNDLNEVLKQFMPSAVTPYKYKGGVYALPDTQSFNMLFYRTDIFKELGLTVPTTWDEFISASKIISLNNMQVALPYTEITDMGQINTGIGALNMLPTILLQNRVSIYNEDLTATNLTSPSMVSSVVFWTDFYTKYGFPKTYSFFNRFRTGLIPMAIQSYTMYATLKAAAPEISDRWAMVPIPGILKEDGSIVNTESGSGHGSVILSISKNKMAAWEYIKWWNSAKTQYSYGSNIESILGVSARYSTANIEAMSMLGWDTETLTSLFSQWEKVEELPEVPGGYYVSRAVDQIFWNIVNQKANPKDMLLKWGTIVDNEIARKVEEYS